jgi:serine phosphatase RsbU (regulator of sigma subunit)
MAVPLVARDGGVFGGIEIAADDFSQGARALLEDLVQVASPALDNARLEERDRHVAHTLQASLLPQSLPPIEGLETAARYLAGGEGTVVGGDLYDLFPLDGDWALVVGDVCGKGAEAAALTAMVRYTIRAEAVHHSSPGAVLGQLNDAILRHHDDGRFCTVLHGRVTVEPGRARIVIAGGGHPPPLVRRASGAVETVPCAGPLLGIVPDVVHPDVAIELGPGDALVCFTDGVTEGRRAGGLFGERRLAEEIAAAADGADAIADRVVGAVLDFQGGRTHDDLALLVLRVPARA